LARHRKQENIIIQRRDCQIPSTLCTKNKNLMEQRATNRQNRSEHGLERGTGTTRFIVFVTEKEKQSMLELKAKLLGRS
jgi:hypothetical protein